MGPAGRVRQQHPEREERNQTGTYKPGVCKTPDVILLHLQSVSLSLESDLGLSVSGCGSWRKPRNNKIRNSENMTYWRRLKDQGSLVSRRLQGNKIKVLKCIKPCYKVRDNGLILIFRVGRGRSHRLNLQ